MPTRRARYRDVSAQPLGVGAFGVVWEVVDAETGVRYALKELRDAHRFLTESWRRETIAARLADAPGVVHIHEDWLIGDTAYIVMALAPGTPFGELPAPWEQLRAPTISLLTTLARLHHVGVTHHDIKPANVLVQGDRTTLLDLGLASARYEATRAHGGGFGSAWFAAPEQRRGRPLSTATDLFSVGCLVYAALTGASPLQPFSGRALMHPNLSEPEIVPIDAVLPSLDPAVAALIGRLLAVEPTSRPTAVEALDLLGAPSPLIRDEDLGELPDPATEVELGPLIYEPQHYHHFRADGARLLHRRTGGRRPQVLEELNAWVRSGHATWREGAVHVDHEALRRIAWGPPLRLGHGRPLDADERAVLHAIDLLGDAAAPHLLQAVAGAEAPSALARLRGLGHVWDRDDGALCRDAFMVSPIPEQEAAEQARRAAAIAPHASLARFRAMIRDREASAEVSEQVRDLIARTQLDPGGDEEAVIVEAAAILDADRDQPHAQQPYVEWMVRRAIRLDTSEAYRHVEVQLRRFAEPDSDAWRLLEAHRAYIGGARGAARERMPWAAPPSQTLLPAWFTTGALIGGPAGDADRWLREHRDAARTDEAHAGWHHARGVTLLRTSAWADAAEALEAAAAIAPHPSNRISSLIQAAASWLEAQDLARCRHAAERARQLAREGRCPRDEMFADYLLRAAAYRGHEPSRVDLDRIAVAAQSAPIVAVMLAVTDAATAWRAADAVTLDVLTTATLEQVATIPTCAAIRPLLLGLRAAAGLPIDGDAMLHAAEGAPFPGITLQALALGRPRDARAAAEHALARLGARDLDARREILTVRECCHRLDLSPPTGATP